MITKKKLLENVMENFPGITPRANMEAFKSVISFNIRAELGLQPDILENTAFNNFVQTYCNKVSRLSKEKGGLKHLMKVSDNFREFFSTEITIQLVLNQPEPPPPRWKDASTQTLKIDRAVVKPRYITLHHEQNNLYHKFM